VTEEDILSEGPEDLYKREIEYGCYQRGGIRRAEILPWLFNAASLPLLAYYQGMCCHVS
jgi:hypothetical protein